jgi:hypothetical protein
VPQAGHPESACLFSVGWTAQNPCPLAYLGNFGGFRATDCATVGGFRESAAFELKQVHGINHQMINGPKTFVRVLLILLMVFFGCAKKREVAGYRVVSYDAVTHQWTIFRSGTFDGKYMTKRIIVVCSFYKWGEHEQVQGPDACHLQVGRLIVPNPLPPAGKRDEFLDVYEMPDEILAITEGDGPDRVQQQFIILKYEVLPDNNSQ